MEYQPTINIGMIGHVANGKTSIVSAITEKDTKKYKQEKQLGATIKLGYANAKIWRCDLCKEPECFSSTDSSIMRKKCSHCNKDATLVSHISLVDSPGHHSLMATMLNGTCVTDATILVESASNKEIPAPQTLEHLRVADSLGMKNICICLNKIDLVDIETAKNCRDRLRDSLKNTIFEKNIIVPVSANRVANVDYLLKTIVDGIKDIKKDVEMGYCKMIAIRSFNINKQSIPIQDVQPGIIGGTVIKGTLCVGDEITLLPGNFIKTDTGFNYSPIKTFVREIHSEKNSLKKAISGGLIGVKTDLDPIFTCQDRLAGSCIVKNFCDVKVFSTIRVVTQTLNKDRDNIKDGDRIDVNCNGKNTVCTVVKVVKKRMEIRSTEPLCAELEDRVSISVYDCNKRILVRTGTIKEGDECKEISFDEFYETIKHH